MSNDTPRPERVTLSNDERGWFSAWFTRGALASELAEWLAAREQALREEIAGEGCGHDHPRPTQRPASTTDARKRNEEVRRV